MKWVLIAVGTLLAYFLLGFIFKMLRLKKNIVEAHWGLTVYLRKKQAIIKKLVKRLNRANEVITNDDVAYFFSVPDLVEKVNVGKDLSKKILTSVQKDHVLQMDGDTGIMVDTLRSVDEKLSEYKEKYEVSKTAYELAVERSPFKLFVRKRVDDIDDEEYDDYDYDEEYEDYED